jgi:hypothetical protein
MKDAETAKDTSSPEGVSQTATDATSAGDNGLRGFGTATSGAHVADQKRANSLRSSDVEDVAVPDTPPQESKSDAASSDVEDGEL